MACMCGHAKEEHGHDPKYPGSTSCTECPDDGCLAFEEDEEFRHEWEGDASEYGSASLASRDGGK